MARIWCQQWSGGHTSYHRNKDDVIEFSRFYNTKYPGAVRIHGPQQATINDAALYQRICDSPRGVWFR